MLGKITNKSNNVHGKMYRKRDFRLIDYSYLFITLNELVQEK